MKNVIKVLSIVLLGTSILTISSCFSTKTTTVVSNTKSNSSLYNSKWKLVVDNEIVKGLNKAPLYIEIDSNEYKVSGFAGCNSFNSSVESNNNLITFSAISSTEINCPNSGTEQDFLTVLRKVDRYEINGKQLFLYKGKLLLLQFVQ